MVSGCFGIVVNAGTRAVLVLLKAQPTAQPTALATALATALVFCFYRNFCLENRFTFVKTIALALLLLASPSVAEQVSTDIRDERFGDWVLRCVVADGARERQAKPASCEISQPLMVHHDGAPVEVLNLAVSRGLDKAGKADWAFVVLTPLDVHLASDFGFGVGNRPPELVGYRNCNHLGCFVVVALDSDRINQMKKASDGAAFFRLLNGQAVKVSFSLKGFTKAFNALSEGQVPASGQETGEVAARATTNPDNEGADN